MFARRQVLHALVVATVAVVLSSASAGLTTFGPESSTSRFGLKRRECEDGGSGVCSGHGTCSSGLCACASGYSGHSCSKVCPGTTFHANGTANLVCSGHGTCFKALSGRCKCSTGYTGSDCGTQRPVPEVISQVQAGSANESSVSLQWAPPSNVGLTADTTGIVYSVEACEASLNCEDGGSGSAQALHEALPVDMCVDAVLQRGSVSCGEYCQRKWPAGAGFCASACATASSALGEADGQRGRDAVVHACAHAAHGTAQTASVMSLPDGGAVVQRARHVGALWAVLSSSATSTSNWREVCRTSSTSCAATGLKEGTRYKVRVSGSFRRSTAGNFSQILEVATTADKPHYVSNVPVVNELVTVSSIKVRFVAPADIGGGPIEAKITQYRAEYRKDGTSDAWQSVSHTVQDGVETSVNVTGLEVYTVYSIRAYATNVAGEGNASQIVTQRTAAGEPSTPAAPSVGSPTTTSLSVTWSAPSTTNGGAINRYELHVKKSSEDVSAFSCAHCQDSAATSASVSGLVSNTAYDFRVRARNTAGLFSAWSSVGSGSTQACASGSAGPSCQYTRSGTCSNHGNPNHDGSCSCDTGFSDSSCNACASGYFNYPTCSQCSASVTCNNHGTCNGEGGCTCSGGWGGTNCNIAPGSVSSNAAQSCKTILDSNPSATSGNYYIQHSALGSILTYCEMSHNGGGWTLLFQRRGGSSSIDECGSTLNDFLHATCNSVSVVGQYGRSFSTDLDSIPPRTEYLFRQITSGGSIDTDDAHIIRYTGNLFPNAPGSGNTGWRRFQVTSVCDYNGNNCDSSSVYWHYVGDGWVHSAICSSDASGTGGSGSHRGDYLYCHNGLGGYSGNSLFGNRAGYDEVKLWNYSPAAADSYMEQVFVR